MEQSYLGFLWLHIRIFQGLGYWNPYTEGKFKRLYSIYTIFVTAMGILFMTSLTVYLFKASDDIDKITENVYTSSSFMMIFVNLIVLYKNLDPIKNFIGALDDPMLLPKSKASLDLSRAVRSFHNTLFILKSFMTLQVYVCWNVTPFLKQGRNILMEGWFPFDWRRTPIHEIVNGFQDVMLMWMCLSSINTDMLAYGLLMQVGLQCDYLCEVLNHLETFHVEDGSLCENSGGGIRGIEGHSGRFSRDMTANLIICITHYVRIQRLAKEAENIYRVTFFSLFLEATMIICSILFQLTQVIFEEEPTKYLLLISYFGGMLIQQLSYYWFCNEIIIKSGNIFTSAYNTPWMDCDLEFRKILLNFIIQTMKPIEIRAAGLFTLSTSMFVSVLQSSYSYFTLLQAIQEKRSTVE